MKVNSKIVSDVFDGEVVVVNLETGIYYSFRSTALDLWHAIGRGVDVKSIDSNFLELSTSQREEIYQFIDFLTVEGILIPSDETLQAPSLTTDHKFTFQKIDYSRFNDMSDLIMIDPIHDADEQKGWPNQPS